MIICSASCSGRRKASSSCASWVFCLSHSLLRNLFQLCLPGVYRQCQSLYRHLFINYRPYYGTLNLASVMNDEIENDSSQEPETSKLENYENLFGARLQQWVDDRSISHPSWPSIVWLPKWAPIRFIFPVISMGNMPSISVPGLPPCASRRHRPICWLIPVPHWKK